MSRHRCRRRSSPTFSIRSFTSGSAADLGDLLAVARDDVGRRLGRRRHAEPDVEIEARHAAFGDRSSPAATMPGARADATPRIFTLPAATCGITAVGAAQPIGIWPASTSLSTSAAPRYGTLTMSILASAFSISMREMMRRADAGRPDRELAGLRLGERDQFAHVIGAKRRAARIRISGDVATRAIGAKSVTTS